MPKGCRCYKLGYIFGQFLVILAQIFQPSTEDAEEASRGGGASAENDNEVDSDVSTPE